MVRRNLFNKDQGLVERENDDENYITRIFVLRLPTIYGFSPRALFIRVTASITRFFSAPLTLDRPL